MIFYQNTLGGKMKHFDAIFIGGGPSGIVAATTAKKLNPEKSFLMLKEEEKGLVPCGIPYIFHELSDISQNAMGPKPFINLGGEVINDTVEKINLEEKSLVTKSGKDFTFEKLIFATGSVPTEPKFIKGYQLEGVEYIKKSYSYMESLAEKVKSVKNIIVVGGGFIGVETAEQLALNEDKVVSLIEAEKFCLGRAFSKQMCQTIDTDIRKTKINLYTNVLLKEIVGENGKVKEVLLSDGTVIKADMVIATIGYIPNTTLAREAGLEINSRNAIRVDNYLKTNKPNVYAIGDCSQTTGFITGRTDSVMLASTAASEARILGYNLYDVSLTRPFPGALSVFSTVLNDTAYASAGGVVESVLEEATINYITGEFEDVDKHPGTLKDTSKLYVKLVVSPQTGIIIGCEMRGGKSIGELINLAALTIEKSMTVYEMLSFQVGTHPLLTTAPTKYVLIKAAENAISNIKKKCNCKY
jgi:NADPH-dependent 2,4-dienoyl-CoA reductase/sulfur reductase-like enzyme